MYVPSSSIFEIEFVIFALAGFQLQDRWHRDAFFFLKSFYFVPPVSNDLSGEITQAGDFN